MIRRQLVRYFAGSQRCIMGIIELVSPGSNGASVWNLGSYREILDEAKRL